MKCRMKHENLNISSQASFDILSHRNPYFQLNFVLESGMMLSRIHLMSKSMRLTHPILRCQGFANMRDYFTDPFDTLMHPERHRGQKSMSPNQMLPKFLRNRDRGYGMSDMYDNLSNMFNEGDQSFNPYQRSYYLPTNIHETAKNYEIHVDLPGVEKDTIDISVDKHVLTIKSERRSAFSEEEQNEDNDNFKNPNQSQPQENASVVGNAVDKAMGTKISVKHQQPQGPVYHRREVYYGSTTRSFILPEDADPGSITAKYENGVLLVKIVKKPKDIQDNSSKRVQVE
jgi:HSP20 family molecular chaperone IbpA